MTDQIVVEEKPLRPGSVQYTTYPPSRSEFAITMLAAIVANSNNRGILPNPEMMAKEALKYTDALILELSK